MSKITIDMNSDLGEGFGAYQMGDDRAVLASVSSANVACGYHAGDPTIMRKTVKMCASAGVAIGAHVSFPDLIGFGRRNMNCTPEEVYDYCLYQIGALGAFCETQGVGLQHVKPHGALYNIFKKCREILFVKMSMCINKVCFHFFKLKKEPISIWIPSCYITFS